MTVTDARPARLDGPTPLSLRDLVGLTSSVADEVRAGLHHVEFDPTERWSVRLRSDEYTDVWLISWTQEQSTELHDHAGSLGALTVVSGTLTERFWAPRGTDGARPGLHDHAGSLGALTVVSGTLTERFWAPRGTDGARPGLRDRELATSRAVGFPVGHVHDVVNTRIEPAVTVHAYSPPLAAMGYYEVDGAGSLRRVRTILTDEPEPTR